MELEHAADAVDCHPDQVFPLGVYATKVVRKCLEGLRSAHNSRPSSRLASSALGS